MVTTGPFREIIEIEEFQELKTLFDSCPDLFCIANKEGYFIRLNPSWSRILGYSQDFLLARPFIDLVHPDDVEATLKETSCLSSESHTTISFENRYRKSDNTYIWLTWSASCHKGKIFAFAKDITGIKRNETFLATIQGQAKIGGWTLNTSDYTTTWTEETYHIHDLPLNTPTNAAGGIEFYHPEYRDKIRNYVKDCIEKKLAYDDIFKFITATGRQLWVRVTGYPIVDITDKVTHLMGTFQDVTNLKTLTDELAKTTVQFADVLTNSPGMVYQFRMEPDGTMFFPYSSPQTFEIYEIEPEQFKKDPSLMLKMAHPDDQKGLQESIVSSAETLKGFEWNGRIITSSGKLKWIKAKSTPRKLESGSILWNGIVVDITKEKELEKSLEEQRCIAEHSARLASLGELAAGVGHEINNPLTIVMGGLVKVNREMDKLSITYSPLRDTIRKIEAGCERIRKIVLGLKSLAYTNDSDVTIQSREDQSTDLFEALKITVDLVDEIYAKEGIVINLQQKKEGMAVRCSTTHVQQIIMNLLSNAKDACLTSANPHIEVSLKDAGHSWTVSVADNGNGISPDHREKLFSAFFTTKAVGKGTGLGLAISKSIVESYGGKIYFESNPAGTVFHVDFPKNKRAPNPPQPIDKPMDFLPEHLDVLVVDDEREICDLLADHLQYYQCKVAMAEDAQTALSLIKQKKFDLIITDVKMPGMDGISLLKEITSKNLAENATKVILTGGISDDTAKAAHKFLLANVDGILNKPFTPTELFGIVQRASHKKRVA